MKQQHMLCFTTRSDLPVASQYKLGSEPTDLDGKT